jgi:hypothetical protein
MYDDAFRDNAHAAREDEQELGRALKRVGEMSRAFFTEQDHQLWVAGTPHQGDSLTLVAVRWVIRSMTPANRCAVSRELGRPSSVLTRLRTARSSVDPVRIPRHAASVPGSIIGG